MNIRTGVVESLFVASGESEIFSMIRGGDSLYFGTYPSAKLYSYNLITQSVREYGKISNQLYIRSLAYRNNIIYAGTGSAAELIAVDTITGSFQNILPLTYSADSFVFTLNLVGDDIFLGLSPSYNVVKYNPRDGSFKLMMTDSKLGQPSSVPEFGIDMYHFSGIEGTQFQYDAGRDELKRMVPPEQSPNYWASGAHIEGAEKLVGVLSSGIYYEMNFDGTITGSTNFQDAGLPGVPVRPYTLTSRNGWIYLGENGLRFLNPAANISYMAATAGQSKQLISFKNSIISANYGGAYVWKIPQGDSSASLPEKDFRNSQFLIAKVDSSQNRPLNINVDESVGKILVCTEPNYGKYGGALWVYDDNTSVANTYLNIVPNHTISSVASDPSGGSYYIGTSVWGGTGSTPIDDDSRITRFSPGTNGNLWNTKILGNKIVYQVLLYKGQLFAIIDNGKIIILNPDNGIINANFEPQNPQKMFTSIDGNLYLLGNKALYRWDDVLKGFIVTFDGFSDAYLISEDSSTGKKAVVDGYKLLIEN